MSAIYPLPCFSGEGFPEHLPLQRFLPPLPRGTAGYGLSQRIPPGACVIDPFGASPQLVLEAAQAGYKTLVICNNPVLQFYIELLSLSPRREDFYAALADFAIEKHGDIRLETYLQSLYQTRCPHCRSLISAQTFVWRRDPNQLKAKIISCPVCHTEGEFPVDSDDLQRLSSSSLDALHRARALQRVNINPDVLKAAEDVSQVYTARSLNFIFTFLNRIERMDTTEYHRKLLYGILICLLDEGNSIWTWPLTKTRPKILSTPGQYREQNLWLAVDDAISLWCSEKKSIPFSVWPDLPTGNSGICLYKGRISGFRAETRSQQLHFSSAVTVFPRPNQAFWSLTAVWSGWLWGRNAVMPMKSALERRRFDWYWYTAAAHQTLAHLHELLESAVPFWGSVCEAEIAFLSSTFYAAENAGFAVKNCSMRQDEDILQIIWEKETQSNTPPESSMKTVCLNSMRGHLNSKNEPADELELAAACLADLARGNLFLPSDDPASFHAIKEAQQTISALLNDSEKFTPLSVQHGAQERHLFWPAAADPFPTGALSDRVETVFCEFLAESIPRSLQEIERHLCSRFTGLLTPSGSLIEMLLRCYAEPVNNRERYYIIKTGLGKTALLQERQIIKKNLAVLAVRLGYRLQKDSPFTWEEEAGDAAAIAFTMIDSAAFSLHIPPPSAELQIIIYPQMLSDLLLFKIAKNPLLAAVLGKQIKILHCQAVKDLVQNDSLQRSDFFRMIEGNQPVRQQPSQISFFPE